MKKLLWLLFPPLLLLAKRSNAQNEHTQNSVLNQKILRLNVGSQGVGAEFGYGVLPKLSLRLGADFIPVSANNVFPISDFNSTSRLSARFSNIHLLADYIPFESALGFRLVGGAAYFVKARGHLHAQPTDKYTYGDILLNQDEVGGLDMNVTWKGVAPYLGIGLLKAFPDRAFNVNVDVGAYYLGRPDAQVSGTGILEGNSSQSAQLQSNVNNYRFLPVVQVNFNFKL